MSRQTKRRRWPVPFANAGCCRLACSAMRLSPTVADIAAQMNLDAVQLHGNEDRDYLQQLRRALPGSCEIWTAERWARRPDSRGGDRLLFDNEGGGSGRPFDWSLIKGHPDLARALIAGGIGPDNVRAARELCAYAIDIGSSLDRKPGRKSPEKITALFDALRATSRDELRQCA